jgi:hypothetical protein
MCWLVLKPFLLSFRTRLDFLTGALAMGGAYLLARALHDTADYQQAFQRYEQQMSAYVREQQKSGRSFAKSFLPGSPLGLFVQQTMMKVLFRPMFRGLLQRQFVAKSILPPQDAKPAQPAIQQERPSGR